jgi:2-polyprenyl-6-methoxyphenol hydroxylase-like FAD-dependent oxidoreductase
MLLARKGHRVLLIDRDELGSDTFSGNFIHQPGVAALQRWGLLHALEDTRVPAVRATRFDVGPFAITGTPPAIQGISTAYAPRRTILDPLLVRAAVTAGAEFRERCSMRELLFEGERVCGVRVSTRGGPRLTFARRSLSAPTGKTRALHVW